MRTFLGLACLLLGLLWMPLAQAQVKHCTLPDGSMIYTDRQCEDIGARERLAPPPPSAGGASLRRTVCARNPQELGDALAAAIQSGDANRIAALYDWAGSGTSIANATMDRLQAIADRSLVDVQVVRSNPSEQTDAPLRFDETTGALLKPAAAPARVLGLLATQVLKNSATPSNTRFGLRRRMDCWWVHL
ncbi:MAG TPA: hypothetical protein PK789_09310 [Thermomonas sp.]|jgi:hypothetical protein|uniref:hypothetical protein n=1 Tax=Thermomonas sp. TaxID=1971895 RepID=UPI002CE9AF12|nr:hypothetical protein [Thermomonas sp.]HOV96944.1 hypothetical protein [Thermomonas sp.]